MTDYFFGLAAIPLDCRFDFPVAPESGGMADIAAFGGTAVAEGIGVLTLNGGNTLSAAINGPLGVRRGFVIYLRGPLDGWSVGGEFGDPVEGFGEITTTGGTGVPFGIGTCTLNVGNILLPEAGF